VKAGRKEQDLQNFDILQEERGGGTEAINNRKDLKKRSIWGGIHKQGGRPRSGKGNKTRKKKVWKKQADKQRTERSGRVT